MKQVIIYIAVPNGTTGKLLVRGWVEDCSISLADKSVMVYKGEAPTLENWQETVPTSQILKMMKA